MDVEAFQKILEKDLEEELIPYWYGASYGSTFSASDDLEEALLDLCNKHGIWVSLDAAYLGTSWLC